MGWRGILGGVIALCCFAAHQASGQAISEKLSLSGSSAVTWAEGRFNVVLLRGPVQIELDHASASADDAVVWLAPASQENLEIQSARIALIGNARLKQTESARSGDQLFVTSLVRGPGIHISADDRAARDDSATPLYQQAKAMEGAQREIAATLPTGPATTRSTLPASTRPGPPRFNPADIPIDFESQTLETINTDDGNVAMVLTGGVRLLQRRATGEILELSADSVVLFTPLKSLREATESRGKKHGQSIVTAAYLEGDVRIDYVPVKPNTAEQRLTANRCYYEFATDRAILTDAIVHTLLPQRGTPLIVRAKVVRQLSNGEFTTEKAQLSTSYFAVPSISLAADKLYVASEPTGDPRVGDKVAFSGKDVTFEAFDVPFFWMPGVAGELSRGIPLRGVGGGNSHDFGIFAKTSWGLFETLGAPPPRDLDVNYRVDYFARRGPAAGLNATYGGGFLTDTSHKPLDFQGEFRSYFVYDRGTDDLVRAYERIKDDPTLRGQILWQDQHYFPDGWQAQARIGYVTDATFLEQWFREDFQDGPPRDVMGYLKRQQDTEAFYFGGVWQPNKLVTTSNYQQEQFEVDRLPQVGYYREGDSWFGDSLTFFTENDGEGLRFADSRATLASQGFSAAVPPGQSAEGYTGQTRQIVWRGDLRDEVDWPFSVGPLRADPYVMGRFTQYSNSPQHDQRARAMAGAGARFSTQLWKVDPSVENNFFDLHQLRHIIEPEVDLFTSAWNVERNQVYVYDQSVDAINDISAAQFAIHQRWETKRGGPGQWRSVDAFTLNVAVDMFANKPSTKLFNRPYGFRGLFFNSYPEESIPRNSVNVDGTWRLSDNTVLLGDASENLDRGRLATLAAGVLVRRDTRLSYYIGNRYIADLNSNITSVHADYEMTPKYTLDLDQEFDFTQGKNVISSVAVLRKFDTFFVSFRYYVDETTNDKGFSFNLYPIGLGQGFDTNSFQTFRR